MRRLWIVLLTVMAASLAGVGLGFSLADESSEPHKKLFDERWYQQLVGDDYDEWMTLTVAETIFDCLFACSSDWDGPIGSALQDWNQQDTTVEFDIRSDFSDDYDVFLAVLDFIADDPLLLGIAVPVDPNLDLCLSPSCPVHRHQIIGLADLPHSGAYDSSASRGNTVAHELGHALALKHESVDHPCGEDASGTIPFSIMSSDCIRPASVGGQGLTQVQPWDTCGVNHAYYDPGIGYAGCTGGTTPTSGPPATATNTPIRTPTPAPCTGGSCGQTLSVGSLSLDLNGSGAVTVRAGDFPEPGLGAWSIDMSYDAAIVSVDGCAPTAQAGGICNPDFRPDGIRIVGASAGGLVGSTGLAVVSISCVSAGTSPLTLSINILADATFGNPESITASVRNGEITCRGGGAPGDVDCNGWPDPIDASLILQFSAGMISSLPCPGGGDIDGDGQTNPLDAALVLQFSAGMIDSLPP